MLKTSCPLNRLKQTQAIVAQVEREIAQRAIRDHHGPPLVLLDPIDNSRKPLAARAHRVVPSLFPAGL